MGAKRSAQQPGELERWSCWRPAGDGSDGSYVGTTMAGDLRTAPCWWWCLPAVDVGVAAKRHCRRDAHGHA